MSLRNMIVVDHAEVGEGLQLRGDPFIGAADRAVVGDGLAVFGEMDVRADGQVEGGGVAPDIAAGGEQALALRPHLGGRIRPDGVVGVRIFRGDPQHPVAARADPDRRAGGGRAARAQDAVGRLVVAPVEIDRALAQQRGDDLDRLLEPADPMIERVAEHGVLGLPVARAEAEDEAPIGDLVQRIGHLGEQGGEAEEGGDDQRPEHDRGGRARQAAEEGEDLPDAELLRLVRAKDEVVREPEGVEADCFGCHGQIFDVAEARRPAIQPGFHLLNDHAEFHPSPGSRPRHDASHTPGAYRHRDFTIVNRAVST
ncbi:MAG: hypothetical protein U0232_19055 [Thermomicrobiales bacterium]